MKTILITGVHGVGKSYFLNKVKESLTSWNIFSASDLIGRYKTAADAGHKKVRDIADNQYVLINAINNEKKNSDSNFILDGHICLFNTNGKVERIPDVFFQDAKIDGIILLQDDVEKICKRFEQRDQVVISKDDIKKMQEEELKYAIELKERYAIDCYIITPQCSADKFKEIIKKWEVN